MLDACKRRQARFVVWFSVRDYDELREGALGRSPEALTWRDTGLHDESGLPRTALATRLAALAVTFAAP